MNRQTAAEPVIRDWHAHVYFNQATLGQARTLCGLAARELPVRQGRVHEKLVGPHPQWSCQLGFDHPDFAQVLTWLTLHRDGLTVFVHPNTGDELADHRDRAIWLGRSDELHLAMFETRGAQGLADAGDT